MGLGKNSLDAQPSKIKRYFRFWLQYYCLAWDLEKIESDPTITEKNIFSCLSTVASYYAWDEKNSIDTRPLPK